MTVLKHRFAPVRCERENRHGVLPFSILSRVLAIFGASVRVSDLFHSAQKKVCKKQKINLDKFGNRGIIELAQIRDGKQPFPIGWRPSKF